MTEKCPMCGGTGKVWMEDNLEVCPQCGGNSITEVKNVEDNS